MLRFIVNVWTFTMNTNLTAMVLFFGSCDTSTMKSNFSLQVCFAVVEGSDKMGNFEVRKSELSKRLDGRIKLNFSMIRRDITGTSFLYESPARCNESHRLKPQKPGGKGGQLPLMQIIACWCFWNNVFILLFSSACSRMLRTICPSRWTHLARAKFGCNRKISSTWSICCFVNELSPPITSLLELEWMGLVESHKDIRKGYRSRNILRVIMVEFRSILPS